MLDSTVDAVDTVLAVEDMDKTLKAGDIMPVPSPWSNVEFIFTARSWMALLEEKPVKGKVLLRTIFLMLVRLNDELPVDFVVLDGRDEFVRRGDAKELGQPGEFAFDGSW